MKIDQEELDNVPDNPFGVIPAGIYRCELEGEQEKTTANGDEMLSLTFRILDGEPYAGRLIWQNLSFDPNAKEGWVNMSKRILRSLLDATIPDANDTAELHGQIVKLRLSVSKNKATGEDQNNIKDVLPDENDQPAARPVAGRERAEAPKREPSQSRGGGKRVRSWDR